MSEVRRHPRRRLLILLIISSVLLLSLIVFWILLRPGVVASFVTGRIGRMMGGDAIFEDAQWLDSGFLEIKGFQLSAPGLDGPEGLIASIDSLLLDLSLGRVVSGDVVRGVEIDGAMLRLAEDRTKPWRYNISHLMPESGGGSAASLPSVLISGLRLETGTYDPARSDSWELEGRGLFQGKAQSAAKGDSFNFELTEIVTDSDRDKIRLKGELNAGADLIAVEISGVSLDDELKAIIPAIAVKDVWEALELKGSLELVEATYQQGKSPQIELVLKDVDLVLPNSYLPDDQWVHYHKGRIRPVIGDPRLHVDRGVIRFSGDSLELDDLDGYVIAEKESGEVSPVPYVINLKIESLPNLAMIDQDVDIASVLEQAPFSLRLQTEDFQFEEGGSADLPIDVADIFVLFGVEVCTVDINLHFWRDEIDDQTGEESPVLFQGDLIIEDAAGAFARFPYPLRNLKASISFDDKMIDLIDLTANGSGESTVNMHGQVSAVAAPSVDILLEASDLPLDAALIDAMPAEASSMMRSLFGKHGALSTVDTNGDVSGHELVGLDLKITRPEGRGLYTTLSGLINFEQLKITFDGFPYPIQLGKGRMNWSGDELKIENDAGDGPVLLETAGGGNGVFNGTILLPDEDQAASGQLELVVVNDMITPPLIEALEIISPDEASLMRALGLRGHVDYEGMVAVRPGSSMEYDLVLKLDDGIVRPTDDLADHLELPGPVWPKGFELRDVEAALVVTPAKTHIESLHGYNDLTNLDLEGVIQSEPVKDVDLSLVVDALPMSERITIVFPENERQTLLDIWEDWDGRGSISLLLTLDGPGSSGLDGVISDLWIESASGDSCRLAAGSLSFDETRVLLDELELVFRAPSRVKGEDWSIFVNGELERGVGGHDIVGIQTDRARFGSPILSDIVANLMSSPNGNIWRDLQADGWFKGAFSLDTDEEATWDLQLEPENVTMVHEGEQISAEFDSAFVEIDGSGVASGVVSGRSNFGLFDVDAWAKRDDEPRVEIDFQLDGQLGSPAARAILPDSLGEVLHDLGWKDGDGTRIENGKVIIHLDEEDDPSGFEVSGGVVITGGSMELGVEVQDIYASLAGHYEDPVEGVPLLDVTFEVSELRAVDRPVVGIHGSMALSEDGTELLLPDLSGTIADGAISLNASLAIDPDDPFRSTDKDDWSLELLIANADLLRLFGGDDEAIVEEKDVDDELLAKEPEDDVEETAIEGRVYMSMFLAGHYGMPHARRGRGHVRIIDAVLGDVPVVVGIQQILHLTVPTLSRPDFVDIAYYVNGSQIVLNNILVESSLGKFSVFSLEGAGTFDWAKGEISAEMVPRGGLMVVGDIIGLVQDQLYAVGISGPIEDPEVGLVPFPGLR